MKYELGISFTETTAITFSKEFPDGTMFTHTNHLLNFETPTQREQSIKRKMSVAENKYKLALQRKEKDDKTTK